MSSSLGDEGVMNAPEAVCPPEGRTVGAPGGKTPEERAMGAPGLKTSVGGAVCGGMTTEGAADVPGGWSPEEATVGASAEGRAVDSSG